MELQEEGFSYTLSAIYSSKVNYACYCQPGCGNNDRKLIIFSWTWSSAPNACWGMMLNEAGQKLFAVSLFSYTLQEFAIFICLC
jgi:hypothetical protein